MSAIAPENTLDLGSQFSASANIFIDPAAAVKRMIGKWPWLVPFVILSIGGIVYGLLISPIAIQVIRANPQEGITPEQWERSMGMVATFQKVGTFAMPLIVFIKCAVIGGLMAGLSSMMDVKAGFKRMFTLVAYCSLIGFLQVIASAVVIMSKANQLTSAQQLQPPFGLDLLLTETSKPVWAILNYFSLFNIWYLVILALAYAYMTGATRAKAILAITPAWLLPLMMAVLGSLFQK